MQQTPGMRGPRPRIETLADLIFGLSLSIGALALIAAPPASPAEVNSHIAAFFFTFLILITSWLVYTSQMSVLPVETRTITFLNVALLILVALVPYLLNSVEILSPSLSTDQASALGDYASTLFALDLTGLLLILAGFAHVISLEEKNLVEAKLAGVFRAGRNRMLILAAIMAASVAPQFWAWTVSGVHVRMLVWYLPLISYWVGRAVSPTSRSYTLPKEEQPPRVP